MGTWHGEVKVCLVLEMCNVVDKEWLGTKALRCTAQRDEVRRTPMSFPYSKITIADRRVAKKMLLSSRFTESPIDQGSLANNLGGTIEIVPELSVSTEATGAVNIVNV